MQTFANCPNLVRASSQDSIVSSLPLVSSLIMFPVSSAKDPHLVITTYGLVASAPLDFVHDENFQWDYVILDEAQKIKNPAAQVSKSCRRICRSGDTRRLILTGTPIMNNLKELWALIDFATSGKLFGTLLR
jgi:SNF2 family DNA or RNA helicase